LGYKGVFRDRHFLENSVFGGMGRFGYNPGFRHFRDIEGFGGVWFV
jgi:hypothetical protein